MSGDWRAAYRYGTFVIWPPDDVRAAVNALRERYDPASARTCEAHITLTQPFLRAPSTEDWVQLDGIAAAFPAFDIAYGPLSTFLPYPCLYLEIRPARTVLELREALHATGLFDLTQPHTDDFVPHMTIAEASMSAAEIAALRDELRDSAPRGEFVCESVAYIVPDAGFRFSVRRMLPLHPVTAPPFEPRTDAERANRGRRAR